MVHSALMNAETVYIDLLGDEIVLTDEVSAMILLKHPEVADYLSQLDQVLADPDEIRHSFRDQNVILYYRNEAILPDHLWMVVVVQQHERNLISTIYLTDQISAGDVLWHK
jgi:hypothetical protein